MIKSRPNSAAGILAGVLWASLALPLLTVAADKRPPVGSRIAGLVARFPARDAAEKDALAGEIIALGPKGVEVLCRMLAPPGAADDSSVRFALHGIATYVFSSRLEERRLMFVRSLANALDRERSKDVQAFLLSLIQLAGKRESIRPLRRYLLDPRLVEPAAQALTAIRGPAAEESLLKALDAAPPGNKAILIKALGELRSLRATKKLLPYASSELPDLRRAALYALANTGDPLAIGALNRVFVEAGALERQQAPLLYLLYARRMAESGRKARAATISRSLLKSYSTPEESHIACAALTLLVETLGKASLEDLWRAFDGPDSALRGRALELSNGFPGEDVTATLVEKMAAAPAEARAQIISALETRGDRTAFAVIQERLMDNAPAVRRAAMAAAARLGGEQVIPDLFAILKSADPEDILAAERSLLRFSKDEIVPQAARSLPEAPPLTQAALIRILAERGASEHLDLVYAQTRSGEPEVRLAALAALEALAQEKDLPHLLSLLIESTETQESVLLQKAVVAVSNRIAEPEARAGLILEEEAKAKGKEKATLLRLLPRVGGRRALEVVVAQTRSEDPEIHTAAVYALSQWPDFDASLPLLELCRDPGSRKVFYLALQGFVRLVDAQELLAEEKFRLLREALDLSAEPSEKRLVIQALARVKTKDALAAVARFLDNPDLKTEAAQAAARMAVPSWPGAKDGLAGVDVIRVLKEASGLIADENTQRQIKDHVASLLSQEGFRPLFNGRDLGGWKGLVADPPARAKMRPQELKKAQAVADDEMQKHWRAADGVLFFDGAGHNLCTARDYGDFELFIDWKIEPDGDSGIYLRGSPQVQIWDPVKWPEGSGGLYNNQKGPNKPLKRADRPAGEWNTFHVRMTGERVTVYLNNALVVDNAVMENYWERDKPIYASGQIELQAHSTPLRFRQIFIRELAP